MVENASKLSFFYRDPERPFDTERPIDVCLQRGNVLTDPAKS